jgi:hypothetical protein
VLRPGTTRRLTCDSVVVELRGFEPLTPCMPLMCGWFTSPCATSPTHATGQVNGAAEGWIVRRREVTCSAVSGKSLARDPAGRRWNEHRVGFELGGELAPAPSLSVFHADILLSRRCPVSGGSPVSDSLVPGFLALPVWPLDLHDQPSRGKKSTTDRARFPMVRLPGRPRHVGVCLRIQYGRAAMGVNRQQQGTKVFLALAVVLVSLWSGGLTAPSTGHLADFLATSRSQPGMQPAALRDGAQALRPAAERPSPRGRLLPLLAILAAAGARGCWRWAGQRNGLARAGSHTCATPLQARAPPHLRPA